MVTCSYCCIRSLLLPLGISVSCSNVVYLCRCKGQQFEEAWKKHERDPDLAMLLSSFNQLCIKKIVQQDVEFNFS